MIKFLKKKLNNKGATLADVVIALIVVMTLGGTVISSFYNIYTEMCMLRLNAIAINSAVNILEGIDELPYEDVINGLNVENNFNVDDTVEYAIDVTNYNELDNSRVDVIKIVTLTVQYSLFNKTEQFNISKLKIREI